MSENSPVVTALATYIENQDFPIVGAIQFDPEMTAGMVTVQPGVVGSSKLHFVSTDVNFLAGAGCDRGTPTDVTTFTDKTLTVAQISIAENLCLDRLKNKYTQIYLKQGTLEGKQVAPEEIMSVYWEEKRRLLAQALDTADWQGDTDSATANLAQYDGWIKLIDAGTAVVGNTTGATSVTTSNIIAIVQAIYLAVPENLLSKEDLVLFMPYSFVRMYNVALTNANLFHVNAGDSDQVRVHGTNIAIKPTFGLSGSDRMFLTYASNLVLGVDGENDTEFTSRLDPTTLKRIFIDADFTRGCQVQFIGDVVSFDLTVS